MERPFTKARRTEPKYHLSTGILTGCGGCDRPALLGFSRRVFLFSESGVFLGNWGGMLHRVRGPYIFFNFSLGLFSSFPQV